MPRNTRHNRVPFEQVVMITYFEDEAQWHCVFVMSERGQQHEMSQFDSRDDAIKWAKQRYYRVRVQIPGTSRYEYV
jgi:hypothetical protein